MMPEFLRKQYRDYIAGQVVTTGDALTTLQRERAALSEAGLIDDALENQIHKLHLKRGKLLDKLAT